MATGPARYNRHENCLLNPGVSHLKSAATGCRFHTLPSAAFWTRDSAPFHGRRPPPGPGTLATEKRGNEEWLTSFASLVSA